MYGIKPRGFGGTRPAGIPDDMRVRGPRPGDRSRVSQVAAIPPWIGNPNWGSKTDQAGLPANGKALTLAEAKTEDESTQVFTVTVQANTLVRAQGDAINLGGPVSAIVEFGTGGAVFTIVVDVYDGIQFSIAASWIRVSAFNEAFFSPLISQLPVQASASISMLPTTKNQTVTKTVTAINRLGVLFSLLDNQIPAGQAYTIPINEINPPFSPGGLFFGIPLFSKSVLVHSSNQANNDSGARTIMFLMSIGTAIAVYKFVAGEKQFDPIPIPAGTVGITIINDDANTTQRLVPQFFLDA